MTLRNKDVNIKEGGDVQEHQNRSDHNMKFYEEYRKIFTTGFYLSEQLKQLVKSKEELSAQLSNYEKRADAEFKDKMRKEAPERKKRFRRTADEIEKRCQCTMPRCNRSYGSEGSLLQHIKLKHPEKYEQMSKSAKNGSPSQQDNNQDSIFD